MTIRRGWFARTNKKEAQAAEMSTPFGLVKVWLKHDKGEEKPELRVTDDDLRQIPRIVRGYEPIPRSHEKETSRTWRVMHNGRELVLVDKPMEGDPTGKTLLSFFVQDPAKRETGRAKGAPPPVFGIPHLRLKAQVRIQMRAFQYLALDRLVHQMME